MLREAEKHGLCVNPDKRDEILGLTGCGDYVSPDGNARLPESLTGFWHLAEYFPKKHYDRRTKTEGRRMNRHRRRTSEPGSLVHASALDRGSEYCKRLPSDLVREE